MSYPTLRRIRATQRQSSGRYAAGGAPGLCHATRPKCAKGCAHELRKDDALTKVRGSTNTTKACLPSLKESTEFVEDDVVEAGLVRGVKDRKLPQTRAEW